MRETEEREDQNPLKSAVSQGKCQGQWWGALDDPKADRKGNVDIAELLHHFDEATQPDRPIHSDPIEKTHALFSLSFLHSCVKPMACGKSTH